MTTMDLTVRLAPILFGMLATFLLSGTIIMAQVVRNLQGNPVDREYLEYAGAMLAGILLLVSVVVAHESTVVSFLIR